MSHFKKITDKAQNKREERNDRRGHSISFSLPFVNTGPRLMQRRLREIEEQREFTRKDFGREHDW